ncbi:hypothetical protein DERP_012344 [Dermatophagoides pteronyssinus]|uniref:Uncharacterized protein n=1 Tax=Dermatophagoides pteronyssinus TaxID=6956 RepID=A0ABQ8JR30_DERPT|nr:hypothetical protein DERP_012344 [Dermatophagoides pteronyssinus]
MIIQTVWTFLERTYYIQIKICTKQLNDTAKLIIILNSNITNFHKSHQEVNCIDKKMMKLSNVMLCYNNNHYD